MLKQDVLRLCTWALRKEVGRFMKCELESCIYHKHKSCLLTECRINALGICDDCIRVSLEHDFIEHKKEQQLAQLEIERKKRSFAPSLVVLLHLRHTF